MEKNCERPNATDDLLSQSYCIGVQKISGTGNDASDNFQVPGQILENRKKAWSNLFEKYSTMVSEVELNIDTLQPENLANSSKVMEQRLPMRKPISMVQYWVNTGNLLNCLNNPANTDFGSPKAEDYFESIHNVDCQSLATYSAEEHSKVDKTSATKNLKIITSSNSSVDTAAYILANNNTTKKAETLAIVEGSKINPETSPTKTLQETIEKSRNTDQISFSKTNELQLNKKDTIVLQSSFCKNYVDKITENIKNSNFDKMYKSNMNSKFDKTSKNNTKLNSTNDKQEHHVYPSFFSDSEGSVTPHFTNNQSQTLLNKNNQTDHDFTKYMKRKKLYNRSDSPAEFTPVSEDNLSLKVSRVLLENCLTLRSEHPALETPKLGSRFTSRMRFGRTKFQRKIRKQKNFSLLSPTNERENENRELIHSDQKKSISQTVSNNGKELSQKSSENDDCIKLLNINNNIDILRQSFTREPNEVPKSVSQITNHLNTSNDSQTDKLKLKGCQVLIEKLPHKNYSLKSSVHRNENSKAKKKFVLPKNEETKEVVDKGVGDYRFMSEKASTCDEPNFICSENNSSEKMINTVIHKFKTHNDTETQKLSNGKKFVDFSDKLKTLEMTCGTSSVDKISKKCFKKIKNVKLHLEKPKYVIVDSSSDESDLIVPLSNTTNYSGSKSRKSNKLSSKESTHQSQKPALSIKETVESSVTAKNEDQIIMQTHEKVSKDFPNEKKKSTRELLNKNKVDVDLQCNEMKENVCANGSQDKISAVGCIRPEHVIITSSTGVKKTSMGVTKIVQTNDSGVESTHRAESGNSHLNDCEFASNINIVNNHVAVEDIHSTKKLPFRDKMQNKKEGLSSHKNSNESSSRISDLHSDLENDNVSESASKIESNKKQLKKTTQRRVKQKIVNDPTIKTVVSKKNSTQKRKSFEINCSSDEECIIPLKRKEQTNNV